jgi:SMP-30/Gluconolactonase/LRE-like region
MRKLSPRSLILGTALASAFGGLAVAQQAPAPAGQTQPFVAGTPLPARDNIKTFGSFLAAESVSYDAQRDLYVVVNTGVPNATRPNDGYISLVNPDGTVNTLKWIQPAAANTPFNGVTLNDPRGSDIENGVLYVADIDTVRMFDMATGQPKGERVIPGAQTLNDLEVARDGTIYVTDTGTNKVHRITAQGQVSNFAEGEQVNRPNGIAFDAQGNIVVVLIGTEDVLTYAPDGKLLKTEKSTDVGNDGLVILADGTKLISSVQRGTLARIRPNQPAESIATGIPNAASMALDTKRNQLVIPQNQQNAITIVQVR